MNRSTPQTMEEAPMGIFQTGLYTLHSGEESTFKIECDVLTDSDLDTLALLIKDKFDFSLVIGIPTGGTRFAEALVKYEKHNKSNAMLIVDDVLTTGKSMEEYRYNILDGRENIGVVIFARGPCPDWIVPIFQMWET